MTVLLFYGYVQWPQQIVTNYHNIKCNILQSFYKIARISNFFYMLRNL